ncbi:MAG: hypothetical protein GWN94_25215 [Phycisphaerae bacterium]|nr:hypothetical protein [Phycisphaerae bacterium]NIW95344.1 hypothetical protein [Phycisphaerae bacterium]
MTIRQAKVIPLLLWTGCVMLPGNPVLDIQRTLCKQQDRLAASRGRVVLNLIRTYGAVGGGRPPDCPEQEKPIKKSNESKQK